MGLDEFCNSTFWNETLSWNTTNPDLTPCFQQTVLVWIPVFFLVLFTPLEWGQFLSSTTKDIPWTWLNISKTILHVILIALQIAELILVGTNDTWHSSQADYWAPAIRLVELVWSLILTHANRNRGRRSSGLLFLFWFFLTICSTVSFRSQLMYLPKDEGEETTRFTLCMINYPLILITWLLHFFADAPPKTSKWKELERPSPESSSSFPSQLAYTWFDSFVWKAYRRPVDYQNLWNLNYEEKSKQIGNRLLGYFRKSQKKAEQATAAKQQKPQKNAEDAKPSKRREVSILPAIAKTIGPTLLFAAFLKVFNDLLTFVNPQLLSLLITYVEDSEEEDWKGYFYSVLMFVTAMFQTFILSQYFQRMFLVGVRARTSLIAAIYRKALRLSNKSRQESTVGEIVNLMSVDAQRFMDLAQFLNMIWSAPLQIALSLYFLWGILGVASLAGVAVLIILIPINGMVASRMKKFQVKQMGLKDERVKLMNEVLSGIRVLKLYAWEQSFEDQICNIRTQEIKYLKKAAYLNAATSFVWTCAPFLVAFASFAAFVLLNPEKGLTSQTAFVSLTLFNIMRMPLIALPNMIVGIVQTSVSLKRINEFLNSDELDLSNVETSNDETNSVVVEGGTFTWGPEDPPVLHDISFEVPRGTLTAVVGAVGSGKSSLVCACLGEMNKLTGRVNRKGSVAYVPQQAWIQNATLKDNIKFGVEFRRHFYDKVVLSCALKPDFDMLPAGDQTEIGEKGINLSGGQKQRVSLARAVYSDADVYFLDDPLSAVDSHVGKHIFENVIGPQGILKQKTRVLVTHAITYLPQVDRIVVLREGRISEMGTFQELLQRKGDFADFLMQHMAEAEQSDEAVVDLELIKDKLKDTLGHTEFERQYSKISIRTSISSRGGSISDAGSLRKRNKGGSISNRGSIRSLRRSSSNAQGSLTPNEAGEIEIEGQKLVGIETAELGKVSWTVYKYYIGAVGVSMCFFTFLFNLAYQGFSVASNGWLSVWSDGTSDEVNTDSETAFFLGIYGALGVGQVLTTFGAAILLAIGTVRASAVLHGEMLEQILHGPMSFFDTTPQGRILNRFSKDVDVVDNTLPMNIRAFLNCLLAVAGTIFVISYTTPIFLAVIVPMGIIYYFIQRIYVATSRQLKRLESVSRSPIYSHFGESVSGTQTIRAYQVQERFIKDSDDKVDLNLECYYPSIIANRWLAIRLESLGNLIILFSSLLAVISKGTSQASLVGLSVSYALQVTQALNWLVRMTSDIETNIVAVERIKEYCRIEEEAPWEAPTVPLSSLWPEEGKVVFQDYCVRYRPGLELVLRGISFDINGGEKVGIVGRTGAGKSSLTLALFRILEAASGSIWIDGVDISRLGLHSLRSRLTIIPQDPVLFSGNLRVNLDPFGRHSDEEVWTALEHAHLKEFVKSLGHGLNHEVTEGGENLSVGQRQLICLARALLRKTKLLVLDEATAAVDLETDDLIQKTIRSEFSDCTVITIAHRLNTIMDSTRVLVLDKGLVVEFDTPGILLQNTSGVFHGMAKDAGLVQ